MGGLATKSEYPSSERVIAFPMQQDTKNEGRILGNSSRNLMNQQNRRKHVTINKVTEHTDMKESIQIQNYMKEIADQLKELKESLNSALEVGYQYSQNGGGEVVEKEIMEKFNEIGSKVAKIDKKIAVLEERTKKIENIPSKDEMKVLILEALKEKPSHSDIQITIAEALKQTPDINAIKNEINDTLQNKKIATVKDVNSEITGAKHSMIKWLIATGIAVTAASAGLAKLFI
ncbi:TPA: hypothetical protein QC096_006184 [Bacillus thuringiensis]|nr:hypothetical protein [Bacillus thuringiensis]HDR8174811.1 hypothetical protein [Bacillus thuringiensis]